MPTYRTGKEGLGDEDERLDIATDTPNLTLLKQAIEDTQSDASDYYNRNQHAYNWWHSKWRGQTTDGLKWGVNDGEKPWPWEGASDTRVGLVNKIIGQHTTIGMFAILNMKVQAKAARPAATDRESQQATTLLNWMLFTHMQQELYRELPLALNWRNGYGASVICTEWEQERQIDYIPISLMSLESFLKQSQGQGQGDNRMLDYLQAGLSDPNQEDDFAQLIQMMSPIVTTAQARSIVRDLRQMRTAEVPVPYVFKSKPRWTALRPMVDILFPAATDDLQRARWIDRVEWVTETELVDRIETAGYDPTFVDNALDHKGTTTHEPWASRTALERSLFGPYNFGYYNDALHDFDEKIELHHFYYKCLKKSVPTLYKTIFHMDVEEVAKHGPYGYDHGEYPFHSLRFETHERPILSSRGIAEQAYTWEYEIKTQRDGRTDFTALKLRPPMFSDYRDVLKIKQSFCPGVIFPTSHGKEPNFMQLPQYDQSSVQIEQSVMQMVDEYFGLFGAEVDPSLKQMRQQEEADKVLIEVVPPVNQTWKLMQQYLPDDEVAQVVGQLQRPFHVSRAEIQGQHEITMTVDTRQWDKDFLKESVNILQAVMSWDNQGTIDHTAVIRRILEMFDYTLADESIRNPEPAMEKEKQDEVDAVSKIVGSGLDQPLPQNANHQLRLQVMQQTIQQAMQSNPVFQKKIQDTPEIMQVLGNRMKYHQRQIQQQANAQIGRTQVTNTFDKGAPTLALPDGSS